MGCDLIRRWPEKCPKFSGRYPMRSTMGKNGTSFTREDKWKNGNESSEEADALEELNLCHHILCLGGKLLLHKGRVKWFSKSLFSVEEQRERGGQEAQAKHLIIPIQRPSKLLYRRMKANISLLRPLLFVLPHAEIFLFTGRKLGGPC